MNSTDSYYAAQQYLTPQAFADYSKIDDQFPLETADFVNKAFDIDAFDSDIDSLAFDPSFESTAFNDTPFINDLSYVRTDTPIRAVPSTFTVSSASESFHDSAYTDSIYNAVASPSSQYSDQSLTLDAVDQDMQRLGIENGSMYGAMLPSSGSDTSSPGSLSLASFSPVQAYRSSFSDYDPPVMSGHIRSSASEYHPQPSRYTQQFVQNTVTPAHMLGTPHGASQSPSPLHEPADPKKKYACSQCSRAFARQFNLKTHMQTHDPNRSKPFACSQKGCGRAFSRKHDLMRHLTSIHRTGALASPPEAIGVGNGARERCGDCGKSVAVGKGKEAGCDCDNVK